MAEIKGYFLTEEEEKACAELIKKMRDKKVFAIDFSGCVRVKAKNRDEAAETFWNWVGYIQDNSLVDWTGAITQYPYFEKEGMEEED